jgi:diguanylate cyclase (GGDEF)-like protein
MINAKTGPSYADFRSIPDDIPEPVVKAGLALIPHLQNKDDRSKLAEVRYRISIANIALGRYESAFRFLSEARQIHDELEDHPGSLRDQLALGLIYDLSEQPEAAFETYLAVHDKARDKQCREIEVSAACSLARICRQQGRNDEGRWFVNAALKKIEDSDRQKFRGSVMHELGCIDMQEGRLEEATLHLEEAARLLRDSSSDAFSHEVLISLGSLYIQRKRYEDASKSLNSALHRCRSHGIPHGEVNALFHLGDLREKSGDTVTAAGYWKQCRDLAGTLMLRRLRIQSGERLISYYRSNDDFESALNLLEEIRREEQTIKDERLQHTISSYDQSTRIDDLEKEMQAWRRRSSELERIRSERENAIRELEAIKEIGQQITATLEPDVIVQVIHDRLSQLVTVDALVIAFYDRESDEIDVRYVIERGKRLEPMRIPLEEGRSLAGWVILNDADLMINSREEGAAYTDEIVQINGSQGISESFLIVRLKIEGSIIGVLTVQAETRNRYREQNLRVLQALAGFVAISLSNSNAHQNLVLANEKIAHMATHDTLTGLPNRMRIMDRLGQELNRGKRYNASLAVLFIDLDGFKEINDTFGHRAGDKVLQVLSDRLRGSIRSTDAVGRLAGDEFLVILTDDCTPENGMLLADQIREDLSRPIEFEGNSMKVTASIGLAMYPDNGANPSDLVNAADQAMYEAKDSGKDMVRLRSGVHNDR